MSEVEEKQINEKTEKTEKAKRAKNRTSLKNIIGGDILQRISSVVRPNCLC